MMEQKQTLILGAGGHAAVLLDILRMRQVNIIGILDKSADKNLSLHGVSVVGDDSTIGQYDMEIVALVNGIGSIGDVSLRKSIFQKFKSLGYAFQSVIHPSAIVSKWADLGEGVQIMAGAIVGPDAVIGDNVIINTRAAVDHGCEIGAHVHIAPGVVLSGDVTVGERSHVGTGAVVRQGIRIGRHVIIGAGSTVVSDIDDNQVAYGCPAKPMREFYYE